MDKSEEAQGNTLKIYFHSAAAHILWCFSGCFFGGNGSSAANFNLFSISLHWTMIAHLIPYFCCICMCRAGLSVGLWGQILEKKPKYFVLKIYSFHITKRK